MAIDRRSLLGLGVLTVAATATRALGLEAGAERYVSAARRADGRFVLVILTADGRIERELALEARGHDIALSPNGRIAVVFARRPGTFALALDLRTGVATALLAAPPDRHYYGHGAFSPDGGLLYATENDFGNARGVLGVYDVGAGFRRIGEIDTHGVGPHDVLLLADGRTLAVANGGIETHPDSGRAKLNLHAMRPSLAFLDRTSGELRARHELASGINRLSIRHLCADAAGRVWFGGQWEGEAADSPELIGHASLDAPARLVSPPKPLGTLMKGYVGSVAASRDGRLVAATSPRGGRAVVFDAQSERLIGEMAIPDCCGLAADAAGTFLVSSGTGAIEVGGLRHTSRRTAVVEGISFDNHMRRIPV
jgi:hypothetical protein